VTDASGQIDLGLGKSAHEHEFAEFSYQTLIERIPGIVYTCTTGPEGEWLYVSPLIERTLGYSPREWCADPTLWFKRLHPDDRQRALEDEARSQATGEPLDSEYRMVTRDGRVMWFHDQASLVDGVAGGGPCFQGVMLDISDRKSAEAALRNSEQELGRRVKQQAAIASLGRKALVGSDLAFLFQAALEVTTEVLQADHAHVLELRLDGEDFIVRAARGPTDVLDEGAIHSVSIASQAHYTLRAELPVLVRDLGAETRFRDRSLIEGYGAVSGMSVPIKDGGSPFGVLCTHTTSPREFTRDDANFLEAVANVLGAAIARKRAEELDGQLQQARRLEAIGRLAGGVAHDFNNLLSVILNYARFAIDELGDESIVRHDIEEILKAAERAAELTQQLLVFSRQQAIRPEIVEVNTAVCETQTLLARTLGEHIEVKSRLDRESLFVELGAGQIEQILINLAVNARDAMPDGGELEIRTENVKLEAELSHGEWSIPAGRYARLTVCDTGFGMSSEVAARAFDPFFTTKPTGSGTGLGLATVYGIAKQGGGYVDMHSEPGLGTAVKVYLPVSEGPALASPGLVETEALRGRGETILLVEDEPAVCALTERILSAHGYQVIPTLEATSALRICGEAQRSVHLLLTDVVMPQLSGIELAKQVRAVRPEIRTLYMSGYTGDIVSQHGVIEEEAVMLEKPFEPSELLRKVRSALDD
jgi:PAS domain S-box-containing protein